MNPRQFLASLPGAARPHVPAALAAFHSGTRFSLVQIWYGNRAIHFEAWHRGRQGLLELGLHFEADALTNARLLAAFRAHESRIRNALGEAVRIEEWDKGWARVWEPHTLDALGAESRDRIARRLASYITALEPIVAAEIPSDVSWDEPRGRAARARPPRRTQRVTRAGRGARG